MEKFLEFLSSNYLYFLIAAGVLFFALIGFVVDMRKRNKHEESVSETPEENIKVEETEQTPEVIETPNPQFEEFNPEPVETFNPGPPMPSVEEPPVYEILENNLNAGTPANSDNFATVETLSPATEEAQPLNNEETL